VKRKPKMFECANCFEIVGVDNLKRLVIPVITGGPTGMDVHFEGRWLCGECYDDFFYFLHEEWDAQNLSKAKTNTNTPPPDPCPPPGGRGSTFLCKTSECDHSSFSEEIDGKSHCLRCGWTVQSGPSKPGAGGSNEPPAEPYSGDTDVALMEENIEGEEE